jgi:tetratricopeptide (TPR) repeat protein
MAYRTLKIRLLFFGLLLLLPSFVSAQKAVSLDKVHEMIVNDQIGEAIAGYSQLVAKDSENAGLLAEYAYSLALGGIFEGALMNLDRAWLIAPHSSEGLFYTASVFALMGQDPLADEFLKKVPNLKMPRWISHEHYSAQIKKYRQIPILGEKDYKTDLKRVNYLVVNALYFQSIALYEEIIRNYPLEFLPHAGYSIVLEKVGLYKKAADELAISLSLMGDEPKYANAKQAFGQRMEQLKQQENSPQKESSGFLKKWDKYNPQTMVYAGGMFSSGYTSFDSRFGVYLSNSFNGAVNLGVSGNSDAMHVNLGVSGYQRLGNVLLVGLGVNQQIGKDNNLFSINPSIGFSFINGKGNASWDIFFNIYCPVQEGASNTYGFSIGKSFYFGNRK